MKNFSFVLMGFFIGATLSGIVGFKFVMELSHQAFIGKLTDNVIFYNHLEQNKPEVVQTAIASSLDWFINMADETEKSIWVSEDENSKQTLVKAKKLQERLLGEEKAN